MSKSLNDIITLDVGGRLFRTSRSTLVSEPNSLLSAMFDPDAEMPEARLTDDNAFFLDRDPETFAVILDFLRTRTYLRRDDVSAARVKLEAEYFNLDGLIAALDEAQNAHEGEDEPKRVIVAYVSVLDKNNVIAKKTVSYVVMPGTMLVSQEPLYSALGARLDKASYHILQDKSVLIKEHEPRNAPISDSAWPTCLNLHDRIKANFDEFFHLASNDWPMLKIDNEH